MGLAGRVMPRTGLLLGCWLPGSRGEAGRGRLGPSFHFLSAFVVICEYGVCSLLQYPHLRNGATPPHLASCLGEVTERESRAPAGRDQRRKTASEPVAPLCTHPGLDSTRKGCSNANTAATPHLGSQGPAAGTRPPPLQDTRHSGPLGGLGVPRSCSAGLVAKGL